MASTKYVVTAPAVVVFSTDDTAATVYGGGPVPDGITDECRERLLDQGMIAEAADQYVGGVGRDVPGVPVVPASVVQAKPGGKSA